MNRAIDAANKTQRQINKLIEIRKLTNELIEEMEEDWADQLDKATIDCQKIIDSSPPVIGTIVVPTVPPTNEPSWD